MGRLRHREGEGLPKMLLSKWGRWDVNPERVNPEPMLQQSFHHTPPTALPASWELRAGPVRSEETEAQRVEMTVSSHLASRAEGAETEGLRALLSRGQDRS